MLVGVGLTQIKSIYIALLALSNSLAGLFSGKPPDGPIAIATLLAFSLSGFLWAYFESRTSLLLLFSAPSDTDAAAGSLQAGPDAGGGVGPAAGATPGAIAGVIPAQGQTPTQ